MKQVSGILKKHDTYDQDYKPRQSENSYDNEQKAEKLKK